MAGHSRSVEIEMTATTTYQTPAGGRAGGDRARLTRASRAQRAFVAGLSPIGRLGGLGSSPYALKHLPRPLGHPGLPARPPSPGPSTYNLVHNWALGLAVLGAAFAMDSVLLAIAGAILIAHVGMDRAASYGLEALYLIPTDTPYGRIGREK